MSCHLTIMQLRRHHWHLRRWRRYVVALYLLIEFIIVLDLLVAHHEVFFLLLYIVLWVFLIILPTAVVFFLFVFPLLFFIQQFHLKALRCKLRSLLVLKWLLLCSWVRLVLVPLAKFKLIGWNLLRVEVRRGCLLWRIKWLAEFSIRLINGRGRHMTGDEIRHFDLLSGHCQECLLLFSR